MASSVALITTMSPRKPLVYIQILLTFIFRAYVVPDEELQWVREKCNLKEVLGHFQDVYQEVFPQYYWVYYVHVFAHMDVLRKAGPLTLTSMLSHEGMFHWFLGGICPGTSSIGKQGIQRVYARYNSKKHRCWKTIMYKPYVE